MVDKKHKDLERLLDCLVKTPNQPLGDLLLNLKLSNQELSAQIIELESKGLSITCVGDSVKLNNSVDKINVNDLIKTLAKHNIHKPIQYLFSTASTNELAKNNKTPSIYLSNHQSQGKGRQAKSWITPLGQSIAMSISHKFKCGLGKISGLNIIIGVAIIKTAKQFGCTDLGLKWPNDVLGKKGKVAGILIEASGNTAESFVVIGIGINWAVRQSLFETIDSECENINISNSTRTKFIIALIENIEQALVEFKQHKLVNTIKQWQKYDLYKGQNINILQEGTEIKAKYIGIDKSGYLQIKIDEETISIASGEVSIRKVD